MTGLPTGTVTFLFTDIEGSTRLYQQFPTAMTAALARHQAILLQAIDGHQGQAFQIVGDAICAAFADAGDALAAALEGQRLLMAEPWGETGPLRVRMGLHNGPAEVRGDDYLSSLTLVRVQRVMTAGHGGQILLSAIMAEAVKDRLPPGVTLRDLGPQRLRGLAQPEQLHQLVAPGLLVDFPPLRGVGPGGGDGDDAANLDLLVRDRLVGRGDELEQLRRHWELSQQAHGHLVTLSGEPGIGKTRLAQELIGQVRQTSAVVLRGGCYEYEATTPYLPFVEAIRDWVHTQPDEALRHQLAGTASELSRLAPEIETKLGSLPASPPLPASEELLRLFDHVARFLQMLAAPAGLLLFVDDLHWADQGTLSLLNYVLRRLRNDRVLFLAAYREVELDRSHPLAAAVVDWNRERLATRLTLGRLTKDNTALQLAGLLGRSDISNEFIQVVFRETEGNPFFIEEVVKALIEQGAIFREQGKWERKGIGELAIPQSIKEAVGRRLNRLSRATGEILATAAALGKQFEFVELAAVTMESEDALLDALDEATTAQLIAPGNGDSFLFTHDKIREVLVEEINPIRRRRLHRRIGEGLEALYGANAGSQAQVLAYHFSQSGDLQHTLSCSMQAAANAEELYAHDEAIGFYLQAREAAEDLNLSEEVAVIDARIGDVYILRGETIKAVETLALALAATTGPELRAVLKVKIGVAYCHVGDLRGLPFLEEALTELDPVTQVNQVAKARAAIGRFHHFRGEHRLALTYLEEALRLAKPDGSCSTLTNIYAYLSGAHQHLVEFDESDKWAQASIALGDQREYPFAVAVGHEFLAENASLRGLWEDTLYHIGLDQQIGERIGAQDRVAWSTYARSYARWNQGRLIEARQTAEFGLELAERLGENRLATWLEPFLVLVHADLGDDAAAEVYAKAGLIRAEALGQVALQGWTLNVLAYWQQRRQNWGEALRLHERAMAVWRPTENRIGMVGHHVYAAESYVELERIDEAMGLIEELRALIARAGAPGPLAIAFRVEARALVSAGRWDEATTAFGSAISELERLGYRLQMGRALVQRADMWQQCDDLKQARADAESAAAIFKECGAARDQTQAEALLAEWR